MPSFDLSIRGNTDENLISFTGTIKDDVRTINNGAEAYCNNTVKNFIAVAKRLSKENLIAQE